MTKSYEVSITLMGRVESSDEDIDYKLGELIREAEHLTGLLSVDDSWTRVT